MDTPIFDAVMYDLEIDPADQQGHDARVQDILDAHPNTHLIEEDSEPEKS